jgi:hypothetical protein
MFRLLDKVAVELALDRQQFSMDLRRVAARYRLGELPGEELPDIAIALMEEGCDSQAPRELAGLDRPTLRDAGDLFERMLGEQGLILPDERSAKLLMLDYVLERIGRGEVDPCRGAYGVWSLASDLFDGEQLDEWVRFVGLASEYEDYAPARHELGTRIVQLSAERLSRLRGASV